MVAQNKAKTKQDAKKLFKSRLVAVLGLIVLATGIILLIKSLTAQHPLITKTFSFSKDGTNFSYEYPAEFTGTTIDTTNKVSDINNDGFQVSKQFTEAGANGDTESVVFKFE